MAKLDIYDKIYQKPNLLVFRGRLKEGKKARDRPLIHRCSGTIRINEKWLKTSCAFHTCRPHNGTVTTTYSLSGIRNTRDSSLMPLLFAYK